MQPGFARALLKGARELGIHTAIETSGYGQWSDLKMLIDECDVVFMDCKCMDDRLHKKLTGVSNERILENIKLAAAYCAAGQKIFILRFPLIPKCNDREENICSTAELAKSLSVELNVLPYHNYGMDKYGTVGQAYGLKNVAPPDKNRLHQVALLLEETGVLYSMGGAEVKSY